MVKTLSSSCERREAWVEMPMVNPSPGYNRKRFAVIVGLIVIYTLWAVVSVINRRFPMTLAPVLFLLPCFLRELDLKRGCPMRRLGSFEWSCFLGGFLFLAVLPLLLIS